jgi:hypothetical protein
MPVINPGAFGPDEGVQRISPRVRLAARLYATGACATKQEAAEAAGLSPSYFSVITAPGGGEGTGPVAKRRQVHTFMDDLDQKLEDKIITTSAALELLARKALTKVGDLMENSGNQAIQLKAAQDLLDRNPETSKVQKIATAGFTLDAADAKEMAAALVASARIRLQFESDVQGDYVRVPVDPLQSIEELNISHEASNAGQELLPAKIRQKHESDLGDSWGSTPSGGPDPGTRLLGSGSTEGGKRSAA